MASNDRIIGEEQIVKDEKEREFWIIYGILEFWL